MYYVARHLSLTTARPHVYRGHRDIAKFAVYCDKGSFTYDVITEGEGGGFPNDDD
jgi:hypothetical protein